MTDFDIIIYHNPCADGTGALWCTKQNQEQIEDILFIPCIAGKTNDIDVKLFNNKRVLFVDICPSYDMLSMMYDAKIITILDHHKTTFEMYKENYNNNNANKFVSIHDNIIFNIDMGRAGCQLSWDYFYPGTKRPWFIDYIADRDLWQWNMPNSKAINTAMYEKNLLTIEGMNEMNTYDQEQIDALCDYGMIKLAPFNMEVDNICDMAMEATTFINNTTYRVWLVLCSPKYKSEVGNKLSLRLFDDDVKPDFTVMWRPNPCPLSNELYVSLRNTKGIDLSIVAKYYDTDGGGHEQASGFTLYDVDKIEDVFCPV